MNKEIAFKILGIPTSASLELAKNAYRKLAKKYHPDVVENKAKNILFFESKMKEINLAFRFLVPYLKSESVVEKEIQEESFNKKKTAESMPAKEGLGAKIFSVFKDIIHQAVSGSSKNKQTITNAVHSRSKAKRPVHDTIKFNDVLNAFSQNGFKSKPGKLKINKIRGRQSRSPYSRYQEYMKRRRRYQPVSMRRTKDIGIERVSKIDPVSPIDRVTR